MEGRWDAELVSVGLVGKGTVKEVGDAGNGVFGHEEDGAAEVIGIRETAVEDGRVERCCDVRDGASICAWQPQLNEAGEGVGGVGGWEGEKDTLGRVVTVHHLDRFVEPAFEEESARGVGYVLTVDNGGVSKCAVMTWGVVGAKANREAVSRVEGANGCLLEFLQGRDIGEGQELVESVFLLLRRDVTHEPRTHGQTLLEWRRACGTTIRSDMEHNRRATRGLAEDGDTIWISTKEMNVILHPIKSQALIVESIVRCATARFESRSRQETKSSELLHVSLPALSSHRPEGGGEMDSGSDSRKGACLPDNSLQRRRHLLRRLQEQL